MQRKTSNGSDTVCMVPDGGSSIDDPESSKPLSYISNMGLSRRFIISSIIIGGGGLAVWQALDDESKRSPQKPEVKNDLWEYEQRIREKSPLNISSGISFEYSEVSAKSNNKNNPIKEIVAHSPENISGDQLFFTVESGYGSTLAESFSLFYTGVQTPNQQMVSEANGNRIEFDVYIGDELVIGTDWKSKTEDDAADEEVYVVRGVSKEVITGLISSYSGFN